MRGDTGEVVKLCTKEFVMRADIDETNCISTPVLAHCTGIPRRVNTPTTSIFAMKGMIVKNWIKGIGKK